MLAPNRWPASSFHRCIQRCIARQGCVAVTYADNRACHLKSTVNSPCAKGTVRSAILTNGTSSTPSQPSSSSQESSTSVPAGSSFSSQEGSASVPAGSSSSSQEGSVSVPTGASSGSQESSASVPPGSSSGSPSSSVTTVVQQATTSPAAVSTASPTNGSGCPRPAPKALSGKRGLCYSDPSMTTFFGSKVSWAYDWGQTSGSLASSLEYDPMLWSGSSQLTSTWNANAKTAIADGASTILAFNEPDLSTQSNMDIPTAVAAYQQWMQPFACQARLAAPAVTNGGPPMGLTWLQGFLSNCTGCTIDVIPIHWYDSATNIAYFQNYVQEAYTAGDNRPIWITEFGASGTDEQVTAFFQTVSWFICSVRFP
jgi:hypothetical protein